MNRAQNRLVDEQLAQIHDQSSHDGFSCYFANQKTLQLRPASTYGMTGKNRICVMDLRSTPAREFEAVRQSLKAMPPHMVVVQHDENNLIDEAIKTLCNHQANQGGYFLFNTRGRTKKQNSNWETILGFWTSSPSLIQSFAEPGEEIHFRCESAKHVAEAAVESAIARFERTGSARRWNGNFLHGLANAFDWVTCESRPQESRANQTRVTGKLSQLQEQEMF